MRKKIIAANWKMNMTCGETEAYLDTFFREIGQEDRVEIVIVPPFTALCKASDLVSKVQNVKLGAQNMSAEKSGAFTGEISAAMLRELFVRYVVLGHSERRTIFGETEETVIPYEPVWAIGTGRTATPQQAQDAHAFSHRKLTELWDAATADKVRIQYGGRVKPANTPELMGQPDIDGALLG